MGIEAARDSCQQGRGLQLLSYTSCRPAQPLHPQHIPNLKGTKERKSTLPAHTSGQQVARAVKHQHFFGGQTRTSTALEGGKRQHLACGH